MEDGYSIFLIDNVDAEYITASEEVDPNRNFSFYPNPTSGIIHLESHQANDPEQIEIRSLTGQLIRTANFTNVLNLEWLTDGVYILRVLSGSNLQNSVLVLKH